MPSRAILEVLWTPPHRKPALNLTNLIQNNQIWHPPSIWMHREQGNRVSI